MRWDELFADLEGQAAALERVELTAEIADRTRSELGRLTLLNRLRSNVGGRLHLRLAGGSEAAGDLLRVGADWLLIALPEEALVPYSAVEAAHNLALESVSPGAVGPVESRLTLAAAVRALAVDRARVTVVLRSGGSISGTPDRVGRDFVDVAVHGADEAPRWTQVTRRTTVAFDAVVMVVRDSSPWG